MEQENNRNRTVYSQQQPSGTDRYDLSFAKEDVRHYILKQGSGLPERPLTLLRVARKGDCLTCLIWNYSTECWVESGYPAESFFSSNPEMIEVNDEELLEHIFAYFRILRVRKNSETIMHRQKDDRG